MNQRLLQWTPGQEWRRLGSIGDGEGHSLHCYLAYFDEERTGRGGRGEEMDFEQILGIEESHREMRREDSRLRFNLFWPGATPGKLEC